MSKTLDEVAEEFREKAEELEAKLSQIRHEVGEAERAAHARGLIEGLEAQAVDFDNKVVVVKVPEDQIEDVTSALSRVERKFKNTRFVILSDFIEMKELHDVELKALGLKRDA